MTVHDQLDTWAGRPRPPALRALVPADAPALYRLSQGAGWGHTLADWQALIPAGRGFGHPADGEDRPGGRLLSGAMVFTAGRDLATLGLVLVDPQVRGRGLGTLVVDACLMRLVGPRAPVGLIATEAAARLYPRFGFVQTGEVLRLRGTVEGTNGPGGSGGLGAGVGPATIADLDRLAALDAPASGRDRRAALQALLSLPGARAAVVGPAAGPTGFAIAVPRGAQQLIGPVIAATAAEAEVLVRALAGSAPVQLDLPPRAGALADRLGRRGLHEAGRSPLMLRNADSLPGATEQVHALASQALL